MHDFAVGFKKSAAEKYKRELDICIAALKEMKRRGIKILPGGDYGYVKFLYPIEAYSLICIALALHGHPTGMYALLRQVEGS